MTASACSLLRLDGACCSRAPDDNFVLRSYSVHSPAVVTFTDWAGLCQFPRQMSIVSLSCMSGMSQQCIIRICIQSACCTAPPPAQSASCLSTTSTTATTNGRASSPAICVVCQRLQRAFVSLFLAVEKVIHVRLRKARESRQQSLTVVASCKPSPPSCRCGCARTSTSVWSFRELHGEHFPVWPAANLNPPPSPLPGTPPPPPPSRPTRPSHRPSRAGRLDRG